MMTTGGGADQALGAQTRRRWGSDRCGLSAYPRPPMFEARREAGGPRPRTPRRPTGRPARGEVARQARTSRATPGAPQAAARSSRPRPPRATGRPSGSRSGPRVPRVPRCRSRSAPQPLDARAPKGARERGAAPACESTASLRAGFLQALRVIRRSSPGTGTAGGDVFRTPQGAARPVVEVGGVSFGQVQA